MYNVLNVKISLVPNNPNKDIIFMVASKITLLILLSSIFSHKPSQKGIAAILDINNKLIPATTPVKLTETKNGIPIERK